MTQWEEIHKSGESWGSLSEDIHSLFKEFLKKPKFEIKHVLDIGCGTGKYLKFLQNEGFKTDGIDSSKTAVTKAKKLLGEGSNVKCVDMFKFKIPKNKYDLIISVSAIHHGTKNQIKNLVNKIHKALLVNGEVFIVIPDIKSSKEWKTFKDSKEIAPGTFKPFKGPEKGLIHSFYTKKEIKNYFLEFKNLKLQIDKIGRWIISAKK